MKNYLEVIMNNDALLEQTKNYLENPLHFRRLENNELLIILLPQALKNYTLNALETKVKFDELSILAFYYQDNIFPNYQQDATNLPESLQSFEFFALEKHQSIVGEIANDYPQQCQFLLTPNATYPALLSNNNPINEETNAVFSSLFNQLLVYSRPLNYYGCRFHLPLYGGDGEFDLSKSKGFGDKIQIKARRYPTTDPQNQDEAQAYLYFHPPIRDYLFDTSTLPNHLTPIKEWYLDFNEQTPWFLEVEIDEKVLSSTITQVTLYQYFNHLYLLTLDVNSTALTQLTETEKETLNNESDWWQLFALTDLEKWMQIQDLQWAKWLQFSHLARLLLPTYTEQKDEGKIAKLNLITEQQNRPSFQTASSQLKIAPLEENNFSTVVSYFLQGFFGDQSRCFNSQYHQFYDDRQYINVAYAYAGEELNSDDSDKIFSLALYVDTSGWDCFKGYAYDPEFLQTLIIEQGYNRWKGMGLYSGYSNYSNVYLGRGYFFREIIAPKHVKDTYGRMLLMVLFYQASLRHYNHRIMEVTEALSCKDNNADAKKEIQMLRKEFIRFTNIYWFHEITSQTQGQEIFKKQQQALNLSKDYAIIKDEMERLDEFLQSEQASKLNKQMCWLTVGAFFLALVQIIPENIRLAVFNYLF